GLQERDVRLGDGLVQTVLFEEVVVFGVADIRKMGVQDQGEVADRLSHVQASSVAVIKAENTLSSLLPVLVGREETFVKNPSGRKPTGRGRGRRGRAGPIRGAGGRGRRPGPAAARRRGRPTCPAADCR